MSGAYRAATKPIEPPVALSVVAPCFNEEAGLNEFCRRMTDACRRSVGDSYEIVLVNDGSRDSTWALIHEIGADDPHIVGVNLSRNFGHQLALTAGLQYCRGQTILIIDADLQDPPELLADMLEMMEKEGADVVYGQRRARKGESIAKVATASLFYRVLRAMTDFDIPLDTGDFRLMSRRALDVLNAMPEHHRFIRGMVSWLGFRQIAVPYDRDARYAGATGYPLSRMIRFALDAVTSFSTFPLRFASGLGLAFGFAGILLLFYVLWSWLGGHAVPGWTSLAVIVSLLGSIQLVVLGALGEYLGRLYMQSKGRPLFIVESIFMHEPSRERGDAPDMQEPDTRESAARETAAPSGE